MIQSELKGGENDWVCIPVFYSKRLDCASIWRYITTPLKDLPVSYCLLFPFLFCVLWSSFFGQMTPNPFSMKSFPRASWSMSLLVLFITRELGGGKNPVTNLSLSCPILLLNSFHWSTSRCELNIYRTPLAHQFLYYSNSHLAANSSTLPLAALLSHHSQDVKRSGIFESRTRRRKRRNPSKRGKLWGGGGR